LHFGYQNKSQAGLNISELTMGQWVMGHGSNGSP